MKYKCKDCGHTFESAESAYECPKCGSSNIEKNENWWDKYKKIIWIGAAIIAIILLLFTCSGNKTEVKVNYNISTHKLEVLLKGDQIEQYNIVTKRNGAPFETKKFKHKALFFTFNIPGTYTLEVIYVGSAEKPNISTYSRGPWIVTAAPIPLVAPQISEVKITNKNVSSKKYTISIVSDSTLVSFLETEYSTNGTDYQRSNIFSNISPGSRTFYVRNTKDISLVGEFTYELPDITVAPSPSDAVLNELLKQMAYGDLNAFKRWESEVEQGVSIPVTGFKFISNSYELAQDALTGTKHTVKTKRDKNNRITGIIK